LDTAITRVTIYSRQVTAVQKRHISFKELRRPTETCRMDTVLQRNRLTFTAIAVVAVYVVIAATTRVVLLGIFPLMMSFRAFQRRESLAPVALICAIVAVVVALSALSHS
jgi:hypothetical protein